jgi:alkylation response protein AidB-like acyl-CoA dehydrogenase
VHVLSEEQAELEQTTRRFLDGTAAPAGQAPGHGPSTVDPTWWRQVVELGWPATTVPTELGGTATVGCAAADAVIVARENGRALSAGPVLASLVATSALARAGRTDLLAECLDGRHLTLWAPGEFVAVEDAEGGLRISGTSVPTVQPDLADTFVLPVRTGAGQVAEVLVRADDVVLVDAPSVDLTRAYGRIEVDRLVPAADILHAPDEHPAWDQEEGDLATALLLADTVGVIEAAFAETLSYTQDRWSFGRQVASYQAIKHRLADMTIWLESGRALVTELAHPSARRVAADRLVARIYVGERSLQLLQECVQMHGGIGVTWEHSLHRRLRRALANWSVLGTPAADRARLLADLVPGTNGAAR